MGESGRDRGQMRTGYTTGACATAAALAATRLLLTGTPAKDVTIWLPARRWATFALHSAESGPGWARCSVIKDAGDDPDVTHGAEIVATVSWHPESGVHLAGGPGVGTVTRPGLGLEIGGPAINPVPRRMITEHVQAALAEAGETRGVRVEISVPRGEEMARKTLNPRLGIVGGISILGTTGIVVPYSTAAFRASIAQAVDVALAQGQSHLVATTGGRSERYAMEILRPLGLPEVAFIEMGEFLGFTLKTAARRPQVRRLTVVGMIGKLAKVAQGAMHLHARASQVDPAFLAEVAAGSGAPASVVDEIRRANTGRHVQEIVLAAGVSGFFDRLCQLACEACRDHARAAYEIEVIMTDFDGPAVLGRAQTGPWPAPGPDVGLSAARGGSPP